MSTAQTVLETVLSPPPMGFRAQVRSTLPREIAARTIQSAWRRSAGKDRMARGRRILHSFSARETQSTLRGSQPRTIGVDDSVHVAQVCGQGSEARQKDYAFSGSAGDTFHVERDCSAEDSVHLAQVSGQGPNGARRNEFAFGFERIGSTDPFRVPSFDRHAAQTVAGWPPRCLDLIRSALHADHTRPIRSI